LFDVAKSEEAKTKTGCLANFPREKKIKDILMGNFPLSSRMFPFFFFFGKRF